MVNEKKELYVSLKKTLGLVIEEYDKAKQGVNKWTVDGVQLTREGWLKHHGLSIATYNQLKIFYKSDLEIEGCPLSLKKIYTILTKFGFDVKAVVFVLEC